jgi:2-methylcitrate dehydratase PrpD
MDFESIKNTKMVILDAIGCGLSGSNNLAVKILINTMIRAGERGEVPIFGKNTGFSPRASALINGTMIHASELDDTHSFSSVHPGSAIIPSALSSCYLNEVDGKQFIEAVAIGYEISCRIGMAMRGEDPYVKGFHPTGICGVFGSASAAGKLFGLGPKGYLNSWGCCGSMASGLMAYLQNGAWTKKLHPGISAQSGLLSSLLAQNEFLGPNDIFEGQYGFFNAYSDKIDTNSLVLKTSDVLEVNRISFKPHSCCRTIHGPVTAAIELKNKLNFKADEIEEFQVIIPNEDLDLVVEPLKKKKKPKTAVEAQFSMPFCVALALFEGDSIHEQLIIENIDNPEVINLSSKFTYVISEDYTKMRPLYFPCELRIKLGSNWQSSFVKAPLGDYTNPISERQMTKKFRKLCVPIIGEKLCCHLEKFIMAIESQKKMVDIAKFLKTDLII